MKTRFFFARLLTGGGDRPTRFHDEKGNLITPGGYIYALPSLITTFLRYSSGYRPPTPWLSYRAQRYIADLLRRSWIIFEFGSGMSTIWFAQRCHDVYSFEHDSRWHSAVKARLAEKEISNVHYYLKRQETYADLNEFPDESFDFILIDGIQRTACARNAIPKLKRGGWIYLDNTDMRAKSDPGNDYQQAEQLLLSKVPPGTGFVKYFTDFVPTNFFAKQGMLVRFE